MPRIKPTSIMKRIFLLTMMLALFAAGNLFGQIRGGARVGANVSNLKYKSGGSSDTDNGKIGPLLGLYLIAMINDNISVQPELYYSSMGAVDSYDTDYKYKLGYIALPVLLRYNFNERFNAVIGPQFGFLLSAKYGNSSGDEDYKDITKGLDLGGTIGLGADFGKINAGLRYFLGLTDINDSSGSDTTVKNSAFQIIVGYQLFGE
jgi:Outer membrane protein beta-barrel domain